MGKRASVREFITRQTCTICDYTVDYMCRTKTSKSPHAFAMRPTRTDPPKQENEKIDSLQTHPDPNSPLTNRNPSPTTFRLPRRKNVENPTCIPVKNNPEMQERHNPRHVPRGTTDPARATPHTKEQTIHASNRESTRHSIALSDPATLEQQKRKFEFLTCTHPAKRPRELSPTKTGSYPHEFHCRTNCSAFADYQP